MTSRLVPTLILRFWQVDSTWSECHAQPRIQIQESPGGVHPLAALAIEVVYDGLWHPRGNPSGLWKLVQRSSKIRSKSLCLFFRRSCGYSTRNSQSPFQGSLQGPSNAMDVIPKIWRERPEPIQCLQTCPRFLPRSLSTCALLIDHLNSLPPKMFPEEKVSFWEWNPESSRL